jgi:hypothetical protein
MESLAMGAGQRRVELHLQIAQWEAPAGRR